MKIGRSVKTVLSVVGSYIFIFIFAIISGTAMVVFHKKDKKK
jgi:hypothetical protein